MKLSQRALAIVWAIWDWVTICLGIVGEMVHHYQDIFFLTLPWLQAQVVNVH